ncbi:MAG: hypothetical protein GY943_01940 [Chloroflexi bacterium]|nr:hypothetical protein [Chloroflexota bacterium]
MDNKTIPFHKQRPIIGLHNEKQFPNFVLDIPCDAFIAAEALVDQFIEETQDKRHDGTI